MSLFVFDRETLKVINVFTRLMNSANFYLDRIVVEQWVLWFLFYCKGKLLVVRILCYFFLNVFISETTGKIMKNGTLISTMFQPFFWTIFEIILNLFQMSSRRKPGARSYKLYSERHLQLCLDDIQNKVLTHREASEKYKIPRSSIILKLKAIRNGKIRAPGRKCIFSSEDEAQFVTHATEMCNFGFPITIFDLRCIVKTYLDKKGVDIMQFNHNFPGRTWAINFLKRNKKELSQRLCSNIKRVRAAVNEEVVHSYFEHLKGEIDGIPPEFIYNYDETNLVDDPGKKKVLTKRGSKYPEAIKNSTKAAFSIMMCGNAAGEILPPYVNYRAEHLWDTWTIGGPPNTRYNRSKSGWFDGNSFEDWFFTTLLPALRRKEGKKIIIGDNLSSHMSYEVVKACEQHNIAFVALPPNSTHLTQPLDVAYFRPLKIHWRKLLDQWKSTRQGQTLATIPKDVFPSLLKQLCEAILPRSADNLKAGFRKTGIYPTDELPVLERLPTFVRPQIQQVDKEKVSEAFKQFLNDKRKEIVVQGKAGPKKRLNVKPGKSISSEEVRSLPLPSTSGTKCGNSGIKKKCRKMKSRKETVSSESESADEIYETVESDESTGPFIEEEEHIEEKENESSALNKNLLCDSYVLHDYVVVEYEGEIWPGKVTTLEEDGAYIKCMTRCGLAWKWPEKEDCIFYSKTDIKFKIKEPKKLSTKRALYNVPELERGKLK